MNIQHTPVLLNAVIELLLPKALKGGVLVDATLGLGGHAVALLERAGPQACLVGIDQDPAARELAAERLKFFKKRVEIVAGNFEDLDRLLKGTRAENGVDALLMDIGVSSMQLDQAERGFSFSKEGPLDMRMNPHAGQSAADWLNSAKEQEIETALRNYGEEKKARAISHAIVSARPLQGTGQLVAAVYKVLGGPRRGENNPATRTFQAIRLKVNRELDVLEKALPAALAALKPGGRLGVISFHSLEDRLTKRYFEHESKDCVCPPELPACACDHRAKLKKISRKPVMADEKEQRVNPRARSARFRVVEKLKA